MGTGLIQRLRRADPIARPIIEARAELAADIVQNAVSPHNWNNADALTGLIVTPDQAVQLSLPAPQVAAQTLGNASSFPINPFYPAQTPGSTTFCAGIYFGTPAYPGQQITSLTAYLNPQNNGLQPNEVQGGKWRAQFFLPYISSHNTLLFYPMCDPVYAAGTTAAADVLFNFGSAGPVIRNTGGFSMLLIITALNSSGAPANNCVWGMDNTVSSKGLIYFPSFSASGATLSAPCGAGDTVLFINGGTNVAALNAWGGYMKIDSETIQVIGTGILIPNPTQLNVSRGANFTTAAAHAINSSIQVAPGNFGQVVQGFQITRTFFSNGLTLGAVVGPPRITINVGSYSAATIQFNTHKMDLGAAQNPPAVPVVFTVRGDTPGGSTIQGQVLKDGGNPATPTDWLNFSDGMQSNDPSLGGLVSARETYSMRAVLTPGPNGISTPVLRYLGVSAVTSTDITDVARITGGRWAIDPITLKGEIGEFTLQAIRDGNRDYLDKMTRILTSNYPAQLLFRRYWGWYDNPAKLQASAATRAQWMHQDDFVLEDNEPRGADLSLTLLSPLALVKQTLPRYNPLTRTRPALTYPNASVPTASLDQVDLDLVTNQLGAQLASRFIGARLPAVTVPVPAASGGGVVSNTLANPSVITCDAAHGKTGTFAVVITGSSDNTINGSFTATVVDATHFSVPVNSTTGGTGGTWTSPAGSAQTVLVGKTIISTDTNPAPGRPAVSDDAKTEMDSLAFLAGYANISSQGRLKVVDCFGPQSVKVAFTPEELQPLGILPGFRQRVPEFWVPWGWNGSQYPFLSYAFNAAAFAAMGLGTIDPKPLDDTVAQWIIAQLGDTAGVSSLADALSTRMVNTFGAGLLLWRFRSNYRYPELEPGDLVSVPTDWFVARDPIAGRALSGFLVGVGIIVECEPEGQEFGVWIRSYSDISGFRQPGTRPGYASPRVTNAYWLADQNGNVTASINTVGAAAVRVAASTSAFPSAATVAAQALQTLDSTGYVKTPTLLTLNYGQTAFISVLAYENADGTGAVSSLVFEVQVSNVVAWMNNQGSIPPTASDPSPFSYTSWCIVASGRGGIVWTWSSFTIYRADGSTVTVPASSSQATTAAPTLSQVAGGSLAARTRCVRIGLVKDSSRSPVMIMGISAESTIALSANNLLKVTSPAAVAGYDGWLPLVGSVSLNDEVTQNTLTIPFGTDWTEPTLGAAQPTGTVSQMNDFSGVLKGGHDWNLASGTTYFYYPCWDVANGIVSFAGGGAQSSKSNLQATRQNRDGYISLALTGPISGATPAVGSSGSGGGGGGCLHPDTVVETPTGRRKLGELQVGDQVRGRDGAWTRITKFEKKPCRQWVRIVAANGESLACTLSHPFTVFGGYKRAAQLSLSDLLIIPGERAFTEIIKIDRFTLEGTEQVDVECEPQREFWAGTREPRLLTHNTYIAS